MSKAEKVVEAVLAGERLSRKDAVSLFEWKDLLTVGAAAGALRRRQHPDRVTFVIDRNINYTNICVAGCKFCAFYRKPGAEDAYLLTKEEIFDKIAETMALGGTSIMLQGGLNPDLDINYYKDLISSIKEKFEVEIHSFSPPEVVHISKVSGISVSRTIEELKSSGLDSIPGGGAEILADGIRSKISPNKISSNAWIEVMRSAHRSGLKTTATMMFGSIESYKDRVEHLERIRDLQDETGGFRAFIPWSYQPGNTSLGGRTAGGFDYLMTLAISRLYLDNVVNLQASWVTQGPKVGQVALFFGANDLGGMMIEENVVKATGIEHSMPEEELVRVIKAAGRTPAKRNFAYEILKEY